MATILVMDTKDQAVLRGCRILQDVGIEVVDAASIADAVKICAERRVDVAIVSGIAAAEGEELSAQIKSLRVPPKVLLISPQAPPLSSRADAHLCAPAQAERIFGGVVELLSRSAHGQ